MTAPPDVLDLRRPCSHCGACCTGTYLLWFTIGELRRSAEIDQPTLDDLFERSLGADAPAIVREWNTATGWADAVHGAPTDTGDLLALLERHTPTLDADGRLARLAAFVREARDAGAPLLILDD